MSYKRPRHYMQALNGISVLLWPGRSAHLIPARFLSVSLMMFASGPGAPYEGVVLL